MEAGRRRIGVEEEFHLVDLSTRRLSPRAREVLDRLDGAHFVAELQRCVVEVNSSVTADLLAMRQELLSRRDTLVTAAAELGLGVVAAGAVPLSVPAELTVTETPRYRRMLADYQLLAREQLICGAQVHVDVADRDEAVDVSNRVAPFLPTLLALSASSPFFADGSDTGYSSARTLVWQRWPTNALTSLAGSARELDELVESLLASDVITDPGMVYFDVRPSSHLSTLELRICDSSPHVDTVVLVAGIFRALVERGAAARAAGEPVAPFSPILGRAAIWRAARSGLEGDLVDMAKRVSRPAAEVVRDLVDDLRPQLEASGDWDTVTGLADAVLRTGSSAARQRRARRRRGRMTDVVDLLVAETASTTPPGHPAPQGELFEGYPAEATSPGHGGPDEAVDERGEVRAAYRSVVPALTALGPVALRSREQRVEDVQRALGMTFRATGQRTAHELPLDVLPRVVEAAEWEHVCRGALQRTLALDAFLRDVYGPQSAFADEVVPTALLDRSPGYRSSGRLVGDVVRAHVNGLDLVRTAPGEWVVIEDNLRIPSGVAYAVANRGILTEAVPEVRPPPGLLPVDGVPRILRETLEAAAPPAVPATARAPHVVLLTSGPEDSAWAEHEYLASAMGVPLATPEALAVSHGRLRHHRGRSATPVDVLYVRMDEDMLLSSVGHDGQPLRAGLSAVLRTGRLTAANALGNGIADDKALYAHVPELIRYYLGEEPVLGAVATYVCAEREHRDHVLGRLDSLVTKPVDGFGGRGVVIGPQASDAELDRRREELLGQPEKFIAQEVVPLSTHPTFDGRSFRPHHVDLRVFVHLRPDGRGGTEGRVLPAALTRVAAFGSGIVNSAAGGGTKDTWVLGAGQGGGGVRPVRRGPPIGR
jgi:carboxylate-amine ligase